MSCTAIPKSVISLQRQPWSLRRKAILLWNWTVAVVEG